MPLDAHYLNVFKAVLIECSMSRASLTLRTSASNVKRIILSLEEELGVPLFTREARGRFMPTDHAERLACEMSDFVAEMMALQNQVAAIQEAGRLLRIGANRWLMETRHFQQFSAALHQDSRFHIQLMEIAEGEERGAVESGECDIMISPEAPDSRRLRTCELPPLPLCAGIADPSLTPLQPEVLLSQHQWGLHRPDLGTSPVVWLQNLEKSLGQMVRSLSTAQLLEWISHPSHHPFKLVLAAEPNLSSADPSIRWCRLEQIPAMPVRASFLSQHPYGCLENALNRAGVLLKLQRAA